MIIVLFCYVKTYQYYILINDNSFSHKRHNGNHPSLGGMDGLMVKNMEIKMGKLNSNSIWGSLHSFCTKALWERHESTSPSSYK